MEIPKYIEIAINKTAKHSQIAMNNSTIVRTWLKKNGLYKDEPDSDYLILDAFIDDCELGINRPDDFIELLKNL